ncbi:MAG TPA: MerR family transcriptional regulator [Bacillota bacterium]|nr:MerR family transcriptional regulator [Bacillota bacterium]
MYTIGELCEEAGLSRGTLLYYDHVGLLKPSARTPANYRCYTEDDLERLKQICLYRDTGMPLDEIRQILESPQNDTTLILEKHLQDLSQGMRKLTLQRQIVTWMIIQKREPGFTESQNLSPKDALITVLTKVGFNDDELVRLHREFEKFNPSEHQAFLEVLGVPADEIAKIRRHAMEPGGHTTIG